MPVIKLFSKLLLISLFIAPLVSASQETGVQLYTFRAQLAKDLPGTLQLIKSMGITKLEGGGTYGLSNADYKKLLDKNGLSIVSWGADFDQLAKDPAKFIADARFFGARYVVCFWIPHTDTLFTIDDTKKAVTVFNTAGKLLKESGLSLCYHPHGYEFRPYENGTLFDYLAKNTSAEYFNFEMDVFWVKHPGQDPVALFNKYPGRFPLLHLKDREKGTPGNQNGDVDVESNIVLGKGDVGIAEIVRTAKKGKVKYFFIEDESSRSVEQVPQSLEFLKTIR